MLCLPEGEMCLHEMEGSGFPVAKHARVTLLPSFTTMSVEIWYIFGETETKQKENCKRKHFVLDAKKQFKVFCPQMANVHLAAQTIFIFNLLAKLICMAICKHTQKDTKSLSKIA